jgi:hypothetical protein
MSPHRDRSAAVRLLLVLAAAGLLPACGGGSGGGAAPLGYPETPGSFFASRTSGVAPLAVVFTAAQAVMNGSNAPIVQPPDGDYGSFHYAWSFGDPGSGTWPTSGKSRNTATGCVAAHVYEAPGSYTAQLTVTDAAGAQTVYAQVITVSAFAGTTYYVAAAGDDANAGTDPSTPWRTAAKALASVATNVRILFRRGETFASSGPNVVNVDGPGILGAYDAGARPVIQVSGTNSWLTLRRPDWRVMDLEITGPGASSLGSAVTLDPAVGVHRSLLLNLRCSAFHTPIGWSDFPTMYSDPHDGNVVAGCEIPSAVLNGMFVGGERLAILGTTVQNAAGEHLLRIWQASRAVVSHNLLENPTVAVIKLHGPQAGQGRRQTRFVVVSDNVLRGKAIATAIGPQDAGKDERLSDVVFERNRTTALANHQFALTVWARRVTVRNNLFVAAGATPFYVAVAVQRQGPEPPPENVHVYHNTVYRADAGTTLRVCSVTADCLNVLVRNNFGSAPLTTTKTVVQGTCPGLLDANNLLTDSPGFTNAGAGDFTLQAGSPGLGAGVALPAVRTDFNGTARPAGAVDLGAFEQ